MISFENLSKNSRRFKVFSGLTLQEFDGLYKKVGKELPKTEKKRLFRKDRVRGIGAGHPFGLTVRDRVLLCLFYYRTYITQDVAAVYFGIGQATVSRSISHIAPAIRKTLPIPKNIEKRVKRISSVEELEEVFPGLVSLLDASEQQVQRPKQKSKEKKYYSGKAHRHTAKVQYNTNVCGLITHNTPHVPGRVNDVKLFQTKHPTFPTIHTDDDRQVLLHHYMDRGYPGAQKIDIGAEIRMPIRKKRGKKLTKLEKKFNSTHSQIRVYVENAIRRIKTFRIMGDRYRNPLKKYDEINDIVCGVVNLRVLSRMASAS